MPLTVPDYPFQILFIGHYGEKKFTRVATTPVMPIALRLTLLNDDLTLRQGRTSTLKFLVERGHVGDQLITARFTVQNDPDVEVTIGKENFTIGRGESRNIDVDVTIPMCYPAHALKTFIITVALPLDDSRELVDSLLVKSLIDAEV